MYRISRDGHEPVIEVAQVEAIEPAICLSKPGRYHVDEISSGPQHSGHTSRRWGVGIKHGDGTVALDPDPWDA
jgi:electron transfer flavoprotein alpha/beta subunit